MKPIIEFLKVEIESQDLLMRAKEFAELTREIARLDDEKKAMASDFKQRIESLNNRAKELRQVIITGKELRPVECINDLDYEAGLMLTRRVDTEEVIESRPMTMAERQQEFKYQEKEKELGKEQEGALDVIAESKENVKEFFDVKSVVTTVDDHGHVVDEKIERIGEYADEERIREKMAFSDKIEALDAEIAKVKNEWWFTRLVERDSHKRNIASMSHLELRDIVDGKYLHVSNRTREAADLMIAFCIQQGTWKEPTPSKKKAGNGKATKEEKPADSSPWWANHETADGKKLTSLSNSDLIAVRDDQGNNNSLRAAAWAECDHRKLATPNPKALAKKAVTEAKLLPHPDWVEPCGKCGSREHITQRCDQSPEIVKIPQPKKKTRTAQVSQ